MMKEALLLTDHANYKGKVLSITVQIRFCENDQILVFLKKCFAIDVSD